MNSISSDEEFKRSSDSGDQFELPMRQIDFSQMRPFNIDMSDDEDKDDGLFGDVNGSATFNKGIFSRRLNELDDDDGGMIGSGLFPNRKQSSNKENQSGNVILHSADKRSSYMASRFSRL